MLAHNCNKTKISYLNFSEYLVSTLNSVVISLVAVGQKTNSDKAVTMDKPLLSLD
jgi:hypothetical protein